MTINFPPTRTRVGMLVYAHDIATLMTHYTHVALYRALATDGILTPLTKFGSPSKAEITSQDGPFRINDTTIVLEMPDGTTLEHLFISPDPVTAATAAAELNGASPLLDCTTDGEKLVIRTLGTGSAAVLKVEAGDACYWLGIPVTTTAYGLDSHPALVPGQVIYPYIDANGAYDYIYRFQFVKETPPAASVYGIPVAIGKELTLALDAVAVGYLNATGLDGLAASTREVHVVNRFVPGTIDSHMIVGDQVQTIDTSGYVAFVLMRGAKIEFYIPGSAIHRVITVPDVAEFDMLDPSLVAEDPLGIVRLPYESLPRTTL